MLLAPDIRAVGTVTPCDQASLQAALAGGGLVTFGCSGTIVLTNTLVIEQDTVLDGSGQTVTISGNNAVRIFEVRPGVVFTVMGLTIANGRIVGTNGVGAIPGESVFGGAFHCGGATLNLFSCVLSNNTAIGGNGLSGGGHAFGGAIYCSGGSLSVSDSILVNNWACGGSVPLNSSFMARRAGDGSGGGICLDGATAVILQSRLWANVASNGISDSAISLDTDGDASGGGLYMVGGTVRVEQSSFSANLCLARAFAPRFRTAGGAAGGGVYVQSGTLHLSSTSFENNQTSGGGIGHTSGTAREGAGGGVFNGGQLNATNCLFRGNSARGGTGGTQAGDGVGGGICNTGTLVVVACNISTNSAVGGRGFSSLQTGTSPPGNGSGGGVLNSGRLLLLGSTLADNHARGGDGDVYAARLPPGPGANGIGGAVWNAGLLFATNSTIANSAAVGGDGGRLPSSPSYVGSGGNGLGGGFYNAGGTSWLAHATLAGNTVQAGFGPRNLSGAMPGIELGGGINAATGIVALVNCIVANSPGASNCWGQITDLGHNLSSDLSCSFANGGLTGVDPRLGPLGSYGGPTLTVPLLTGSPALDAADGAACTSVDQRGHARPFGAGCDIGAFESSPPYTVRGAVRGYGIGPGITVTAGAAVAVTDSIGNYALDALAGGGYTVGPSSLLFVFVPANSMVTLGPDIIGLDFDAYRSNGLVMQKWTTSLVRGVIAGAVGDIWEIQRSSELPSWLPFATNSLPASGIWEFFDASEPGSGFYRGVRH